MANLTNLNNKFLVQTGGNVGIGTTSPTAKLHLAVSSANDDTFHIFNGSVRTHLLASESTNGVIYMRSSANTNTVRINSSGLSYFNGGNVGIGTTSPVVKLAVKSSQEQLTLSEGDLRGATFDYRSSTGNLNIATNGINARTNPQFTLDLNGNVGVGTSTPDTKLNVGSGGVIRIDSDSTGANNFLEYYYSASYIHGLAAEGDRGLRMFSQTGDSSAKLTFYTEGSERMRITSGGDLCVGVTTALGRIHMHNSGTSYLHISNDTTGSGAGSGTDIGVFSGQSDLQINNREAASVIISTSDTPRLTVNSSGNVGIGTTSPNAKLDILGASSDQLRLRTAESEEYKIGRNSSTGLLEFYGTQSGYTGYVFGGVNGTRLTIDSSGNATFAGKILVGVGTTAAASINAFSTTVSTGLHSALRIISQPSASNYWDIGATNGASTILNFYHNANTTPKITFTHLGGATFAGTISAVGASTFTLNDGIFIKAVNGTNNVAATNVWGYGLYEGTSKLGEISLVRDGSNSQMYIGTTGANQVLRIGSANKVTALTIDASQNATFAGGIKVNGPASYNTIKSANEYTLGFNDSNDVNQWWIKTYTNGAFALHENGVGDKFTILAGGNVGIGTTAPAYKLEVAGTIGTEDRLAIQQTNFGYSSTYKVVQYGETGSTKAISLGYNPSSNTNGGFSGTEILIPNNIRILAPNAADNQFYGVMMFNSSDKLLIGSSNYLIDSNFIMCLDPATKNVGIGRSPVAYGSFTVLDLAGSSGAIQKLIHTGSTVELQSYASSTVGAVGTATNHPLLFTTNDTERMRITSAGDIIKFESIR